MFPLLLCTKANFKIFVKVCNFRRDSKLNIGKNRHHRIRVGNHHPSLVVLQKVAPLDEGKKQNPYNIKLLLLVSYISIHPKCTLTVGLKVDDTPNDRSPRKD